MRDIIRPVYVIYHDQCPDGFGAAWAAFQALGYTTGNGSPVHYIPSRYGQKPPEMDPEGVVYILDFSYNLETMTNSGTTTVAGSPCWTTTRAPWRNSKANCRAATSTWTVQARPSPGATSNPSRGCRSYWPTFRTGTCGVGSCQTPAP